MLSKIQRFGGAMFTPVLLFPFAGILVGLTIVLKNTNFTGELADPEGFFWKFMMLLETGGWTIFRNMPLLFAIGLPIGLAKKASSRACMAVVVSYMTYNYFIGAYLTLWPDFFGVDFTREVGGTSGLAMIAGVKTLDTNIVGSILVAAVVTAIHNRFFDKKLPEYIGIFQGAAYVVIVSYCAVLGMAFVTCLVWPHIQSGIEAAQVAMVGSGVLGVWVYTFLERFLIPTGLHHFIYGPFMFGPAAIEGGVHVAWASNINVFAQSTQPLIELFPAGGFALYGNSKIFGGIGIAAAIYTTAKPERRKIVLGLLIPAVLTAMLVGITEPLEFTFLFVAPYLFAIHSVLAATLAATLYAFGVTGQFSGGLIEFISLNWMPMWANHSYVMWVQLAIGFGFTVIYFVVFRALILKFNVLTPGREKEGDETKLRTKEEYRSVRHTETGAGEELKAAKFISALGGKDNIETLGNCATRLRVTVVDPNSVAGDRVFKQLGAIGVVRNGNAIQVIIGLSVSQIKEECSVLLKA
ncbi:alpha-glucoside-specific PTS transporter subunit IIBC [Photobacterium satsumensis]|uniref:alpha-glucoside-specific PTS transporter subunit IIBC n=1 Tax=Photobacterium satsumensis TaxID=2910239 RepID=UPI003D10FEC4